MGGKIGGAEREGEILTGATRDTRRETGDEDDPGAEKGEVRGQDRLSGTFKPRREEIQKSSRP